MTPGISNDSEDKEFSERSHFGHTTSHVLMYWSQIRIIEGEHGIIAYESL